jgi:hypothetical protein
MARQMQRLLAAPAEDERIASFQPYHPMSGLCQPYENAVDAFL